MTAFVLILAPVALLFAAAVPAMLVRLIAGRGDRPNDYPGIDVLGDGWRRLD